MSGAGCGRADLVRLESESLKKNSDILLLVVGAGLLGPLTGVGPRSRNEAILEP